jgi:hypothetical protein
MRPHEGALSAFSCETREGRPAEGAKRPFTVSLMPGAFLALAAFLTVAVVVVAVIPR